MGGGTSTLAAILASKPPALRTSDSHEHRAARATLGAPALAQPSVDVDALRLACERGDVKACRASLWGVPGDGDRSSLEGQRGHSNARRRLAVQDTLRSDACRGLGGYTPLHYAARAHSPGCISALLAAGATATDAGVDRVQPLHLACMLGSGVSPKAAAASVRLLLAAGAAVNAQDDTGETPLHVAARTGHRAAVTALLSAGASLHVVDRLGDAPWEVASTAALATALRPGQARPTHAAPQRSLSLPQLPRLALHKVCKLAGADVLALACTSGVLAWVAEESGALAVRRGAAERKPAVERATPLVRGLRRPSSSRTLSAASSAGSLDHAPGTAVFLADAGMSRVHQLLLKGGASTTGRGQN